jgi:hypothetical protein
MHVGLEFIEKIFVVHAIAAGLMAAVAVFLVQMLHALFVDQE